MSQLVLVEGGSLLVVPFRERIRAVSDGGGLATEVLETIAFGLLDSACDVRLVHDNNHVVLLVGLGGVVIDLEAVAVQYVLKKAYKHCMSWRIEFSVAPCARAEARAAGHRQMGQRGRCMRGGWHR